MGMYNNLCVKLTCPKCGYEAVMDVQFYIGELWLNDYILGDKIIWKEENKPGNGVPRPKFGNDVDQGYCDCANCGVDFWVDVVIENDTCAYVRKDEPNYSAGKRPKYE